MPLVALLPCVTPHDEVGHSQRPAHEITLRLIAVQRLELVPDDADLHPDHAQAQVMGQIDGGAHDPGVVLVRLHAHHERLADLELIDRQALRAGQRRVARSEIVDGQLEAALGQAVQGVLRPLWIVHDRALGDLQAKGLGRHMMFVQPRVKRLGNPTAPPTGATSTRGLNCLASWAIATVSAGRTSVRASRDSRKTTASFSGLPAASTTSNLTLAATAGPMASTSSQNRCLTSAVDFGSECMR